MQIREQLNLLALDDQAVWDHEHDRIKRTGDVQAPWYIRAPFSALCVVLDLCFTGRPIQRFWVLETVARIPYFAFISILHLYESLGFWRAGAELRKIHFAEEWNELHHLQVSNLADTAAVRPAGMHISTAGGLSRIWQVDASSQL